MNLVARTARVSRLVRHLREPETTEEGEEGSGALDEGARPEGQGLGGDHS